MNNLHEELMNVNHRGVLQFGDKVIPVRITEFTEELSTDGHRIDIECESIIPFSGGRDKLKQYLNNMYGVRPRVNEIISETLKKMEMEAYIRADITATESLYNEWAKRNIFKNSQFEIEKVIFNDPATIVFWEDGTKTVVKATNEPFDPEKGLAMAISKRALGDKGNYFEVFKKHLKGE